VPQVLSAAAENLGDLESTLQIISIRRRTMSVCQPSA